jgi:maltooligosyltrehalose trehalohydrolase
MHTFWAWAPLAKNLEVEIAGKRYPMGRRDRGWWSGKAEAGPGADYAFVVNGEWPAVPDPRSEWQPQGVHGPSRLLDHRSFLWTDATWHAPSLASALIYELHVGTFTPEGTLDSAISKLDYLRDLGVTHIEVLPLASFSGSRGWGYDGVSLYAPQESYGGPEAVKRFVNAAHEKGIAVLIDVVYNHFGPAGNYTGKFGPYIVDSHHTPWGGAVNFEAEGSAEARRFFIDNALMWLREYHFDGLRLDAVHAFIDRSAIHILEELADEVRALSGITGQNYVVIAESDLNNPQVVKGKEAGGFGLDAQWSDDFHHALWVVLTGERSGYYEDFHGMADLATALREVFVYQGQYSAHRGRRHGRPVVGLPGYRFLGYIQNHDQIGNRARGERLSHLVDPGRVKIAAAVVLLSPFVPMLFQGEEFAASAPFQYFTDHDKELGRLVSEGRKREFAAFGWDPAQIPDPQDESTFLRSKLNWNELSEPGHAEILGWYKRLIQLRRERLSLINGNLTAVQVRYDEAAGWFAMRRGEIELVFNVGSAGVTIDASAEGRILLASDATLRLEGGHLALPPSSIAILELVTGEAPERV